MYKKVTIMNNIINRQNLELLKEFELNVDSPFVENIGNRVLFKHQACSIQRMIEIENGSLETENYKVKSNFGVLGLKVGSGKSTCILGLIDLQKRNSMGINESGGNCYTINRNSYVISKKTRRTAYKSTLIVVPHPLVYQWVEEMANFDLKVFNAASLKCKEIEKLVIPELQRDYDIVLISNTKFKNLGFNNEWKRIVIDEFDSIGANPYRISGASFTWLISASYNQIQIYRHILPSLVSDNRNLNFDSKAFTPFLVIANQELIDLSINNFIVERSNIVCKTSRTLRFLRDHVSKDILSMISGGDINTAARILGGNVNNETELLNIVAEKTKKDIDILLDRKTRIIGTEPRNRIDRSVEIKKHQLENLKDAVKNLSHSECLICMDLMKTPVFLPCVHSFCFECIVRANMDNRKYKCPVCRAEYDSEEFTVISDGSVCPKLLEENVLQDKPDALLKLMKEIVLRKGKTLLFSDYDASFDKVIPLLEQEGIKFKLLCGTAKTIKKAVDSFNNGLLDLLLVNSKHKGAGLNLEQTTDIILYHKLTIELEKQVIGRALRSNRNVDLKLTVHQLQNEIE